MLKEVGARPDSIFAEIVRWIKYSLPEGRLLNAEVWRRRHRGILTILWLHAAAIFCYSLYVTRDLPHSIFEASFLVAAAMLAGSSYFSRATRETIASLGLLIASSLLVHLSGGLIEMHFHFFIMIPIVALYQSWRPFLLAISYVLLEHGIGGIIAPYALYNHIDAVMHPWRWAGIHTLAIMGDSLACIAMWRSMEAASMRTERILKAAGEGIYEVDDIGLIVFINPAGVALLGRTENELIGQSAHDIFHRSPDEPGNFSARNCRACALDHTEERQRGEQLFYRSDGAGFPIEFIREPLLDRPGSQGAVITFRDVTERKKAELELRAREASEAASRAKTEFLSRMSHELRTPMNAILGFGQLLEMEDTTPDQKESVDNILQAGRHLLGLINEVLDIARIEEGRMTFSVEPIAADDALTDCLSLVENLAAQRDVRISVNFAAIDKVYLLADLQRLRQVLINILSNAVKYNRPGGTVTIMSEVQPKGLVRISIADNGVGIAPEKLQRLFMPFDRLGAEQTDVEGTGLGLALSKRLIEAMDGAIGVNSVIGQGSTFWIELPWVGRDALAIQKEDQRLTGKSDRYPHYSGTILYIEDNVSNLRLVESILERRPQVRLISSRTALDAPAIRRCQPDLILLDLHLPGIPGEELLRQLKADPTTAHIPIVIISADATSRQINRLRAAGACAYLTKPIDIATFLNTVDNALLAARVH